MYLARVLGSVVATTKAEGLAGATLLWVQPVDTTGKPVGEPHAAVDRAQAGEGDWVTCVGSREAALACEPTFVPVDAAVIGIVDEVSPDEDGGASC